jgi:hypothetical protein
MGAMPLAPEAVVPVEHFQPNSRTSALDLTFVPPLPRVRRTNVKSKERTSFIKLLVSLVVLTFANEVAAK